MTRPRPATDFVLYALRYADMRIDGKTDPALKRLLVKALAVRAAEAASQRHGPHRAGGMTDGDD
jgi:hypothetical protein